MSSTAPAATRLTAALVLFLAAPLVAEYLLGDIAATDPWPMVALAPLYGSGALLLREIVRRCGGGLRMLICLTLAYGVCEEGLITQSLFNPDFLGLRLLDYGFVPYLGTGLPWAVDVLTVHALWSLLVPIALAEGLFADARQSPWLGRFGITLAVLLCAAGAAMSAAYALKHGTHFASPLQLGGALVLVIALVAIAFAGRRPVQQRQRQAPPWGVTLITTFGFGVLFLSAYTLGRGVLHAPWPATVGVMIALDVGLLIYFAGSVGASWRPIDSWAAAMGGVLAYALDGFMVDQALHGAADLIPHSVLAAAILLVSLLGGRRAAMRRAPT